MTKPINRQKTTLTNVHKVEPVLTAATISGVLIAGAALFNIALETSTVETIIAVALPIILGLFARAKVTPVAKQG